MTFGERFVRLLFLVVSLVGASASIVAVLWLMLEALQLVVTGG